MDLSTSVRPPVGRRMKAKAPPPPPAPQPAPRRIFRNAVPDGGGSSEGETKENMLRTMVDLHITLPNAYQTTITVDGRKALMDLLVDLCSQYHLNPAYHTLELLSPEAQSVSFKPNALLGTLDVSCALIKERVAEERVVKKPPPKVPEKTVRLVVNYHRGQKAVVRVNPQVPLQSLVPVICQKCEFDPAHVLLLRDSVSNHELDLRKSLSELEIRDLYVLDQTLVLRPQMASAPVLNYSAESLRSSTQSASGLEKKGLLGLFKFNRRKSKGLSVVGGQCVEVRPNTLGQSQSAMNLSKLSPKTEPKKRRAPAPPPPPQPALTHATAMVSQIKPGSPQAGSQMKKRKAPVPPPTPVPSTPEPLLTTPAAVVHIPAPTQCQTTIPVQVISSTPQADDSLSDLSHSIEDSEPAGSICSSSSSDAAAESATSSLAEEPMAEPVRVGERPVSSKPELELEPEPEPNPQPTSRNTVKQEPGPSSTLEETESALELKMEEVENNRHSAITWLHSVEQKTEQEVETVSVCSSESLADQGYAASEGMADDFGLLSSPSDLTHPTSPEDTMSLGHVPSPTPSHQPKECSSDSDEGCATWGSRHRSGEGRQGNQADKRKNSYEDAEITAEIHLTLADLDADLAEANHSDEASVCAENEIPVSVVDVDVPVTTIDEVPVDDLPDQIVNSNDLDAQNKNNNAHLSNKTSVSQTQADQNLFTKKIIINHSPKTSLEPETLKSQESRMPQRAQSSVVQCAPSVPESRLMPPPLVRSHSMDNPEVQRAFSKAPTSAQIMITHSPMSRFGLKTFTVIPPKPAVSHNQRPAGSLGSGAIKIDELGNMVKQGRAKPASTRDNSGQDEATNDLDSPLLDKAKAFWSSAEKQDPAPVANKEASVRIREAEVPKPVPVTVISHPPEKPSVEETQKEDNGSTNHSASVAVNKITVSDPAEERKTPFFFKPSRRTSSQYVASAIAKYTRNPSDKINESQEPSEPMTDRQGQLGSRFRHEIRSYSKDSHASTNASTKSTPFFLGPKRSQSYPGHIAEKQYEEASCEEPHLSSVNKSNLPFNTANTKPWDSVSVNAKPQQQTQASTQCNSKDHTSSNSTPGNSSPVKSPTNPTRPPIPKKPEIHNTGVLPEPNQVSLFGPVKKFKPVILKSVERETSLHSSLMEAIQSGEGIDRLRKISGTSLTSTTKKPSYVESENERSALLSAIRAQSISGRLKKTGSEAASELEQFRMAELDRSAQRDTPSPSPPDPPAFAPPPPPAFVPPPPPPPPPSAPSKPAVVLPVGGNPEMAREALLEAIRSGAGAERLRKVPVGVKTLKVNGRLGIIRTPSTLPQGH